MKKISFIILMSILSVNSNLVFADTQIGETVDPKVQAIIEEIEKAKNESITQTDTEQTTPQTQENNQTQETPKEENVALSPVVEETKEPLQVTPTTQEPKKFIVTMPTVPKVPTTIKVESSVALVDKDGNIITKNLEEIYPKRQEVIFTNRVAPERFRKKKVEEEKVPQVGDIQNSRVTAYLQSPLLSVEEVVKKLQDAGFEVLSKFEIDKKEVVSIVYTNEAMKQAASLNMRGFAGTLRILVDSTNNLVNISNPIYVMRAFMQNEYNSKLAEDTLEKLRGAFSNLKASNEIVKFSALEKYRFMENMPYYQDMKVIAEGKNEELLAKARKSKDVVYEQHLDNGSIVIGVELGRRTTKFVKKIGYSNGGLLPYPVLIENGEAKIMAPQYYIAVMYPMLKMSAFMTIATVPGAINKDIDKIFR